MAELLERVRELLDVDTVAALVLDRDSMELVAMASTGLEDSVRRGVRIPVGKGFAGRIALAKQPVVLERVDHTTVLNPTLWATGIRSLLGVPLLVGGNVVGIMHVGTLVTRRFTDEDIRLLQVVADRLALLVQANASTVRRGVAAALQRSLLPARLPAVAGLELAARYVPGSRDNVGGDWYDVFDLPSGGLGIVIGDVVGSGLRAAVVMGRLRSALRAYALDDDDPAEVLGKLDRKARHFEPDMMATVQYAVLEPSFERLRLSSAGHLCPVVSHADQPAAFAELPTDPPIGVHLGGQRRSRTIDLPAGTLVSWYTDGLIERRGESLDVGLERLRSAVTPVAPESLCARLMDQLVGDSRPEDDVALLVLRRA